MIAGLLKWRFVPLSAVLSGVKELREAMIESEQLLRLTGQRTILFIDEIHRFNKSQQDALLPFVEKGSVVLIGATTENPSFEVNAALLSRLRVQVLKELSSENLVHILSRAQAEDAQLQGRGVKLNGATLEIIATQSQGDARKALNVLEYISLSGAVKSGDEQNIDEAQFQKLMQKAILYHDKSGHQHYDAISALHKSIRNSDVDASLYWLARMLEAGDEPLYVARRLVRFASEDIGLADNRALSLALDAKEAAHFMGMPECELALAQAVVFMALAPKNNSLYESYGRVKKSLQEGEIYPVPYHLRNAVTKFDSKVGFGKGYEYAHDHPEQPDNIKICT
jgi:putative ATPase